MGLSKKIREARPKLSLVSPLVYSISWGFAVTNFMIAHSLYVSQTTFMFDHRIWSIIFVLLGLGLTYGLVMNEWKVTKRVMVTGLFVKATWTIFLVVLAFQEPSTTGVLGIWILLSYIQAMSIVHFIPDGVISE